MAAKLIIWLIEIYQHCISPLFGQSCKFTPSCSQYMADSVNNSGIIRGITYGLWRIIRCNPFSEPRHDPAKGCNLRG